MGVEKLPGVKVIKPHEPVGLIEPVLPQKGRLGGESRQIAVLHHRQIGREKHPLQLVFFIQGRGQGENLQIGLGGGAHNQLGALTRRGKPGRVAVFDDLLPALGNAVP